MIKQSLSLLGLNAKDKITGFSGVISSVTFDLYGCVQCILTPVINPEGKRPEAEWFDIKRLDTSNRVMDAPDFEPLQFGEEKGPGERPRTMPR